jgi:uncharacterized protein (DUF2235 family)
MTKNIVVFSDGTGQEGGAGNNTNVYKTFQMIESRSDRQISFYDRGLGIGAREVISSVTGAGISRNILECYRFIYDNFSDGDKIFLFGFSRGAATVRSLAGFIDLFGILPASRPDLIAKAYKIYEISNETKRLKRADDFVQNNSNLWCDVHFLGVWDTVAALGVPSKTVGVVLDKLPFGRHTFHDFKLSKRVKNARHAIAIDDERRTFHPIPWREDLVEEDQTLKQVWFAGMHTDVGGGYDDHGLSDVSFTWMLREAIQEDLRIYARHEVECFPKESAEMNDSRSGLARLFRKAERKCPPSKWLKNGKPTVHESVIMRKNQVESYQPWILNSNYESAPWRKDVQELTKILEQLVTHLKGIDRTAVETYGGALQDGDSLRDLRVKLDMELRIAHALVPRGKPEVQEKPATLARQKELRRQRGEYRGEFNVHSRELIEDIEALDAKLQMESRNWQEINLLKKDVDDKMIALYKYYLVRMFDFSLYSGDTIPNQ